MKKSQLRKSLIAVSALSVSIASQLGAATYDSNGLGGGPWSAPASWTYIAGLPVGTVPDTFIGDVATILATDTIDYDGGGNTTPLTRAALDPSLAPLALGAGSLAVSNGGSLTVDGGTFTQAVGLFNEIRIGDGGGGFLGNTGVGTLTIRNAGIFVTGDGSAAGGAIGLVVGGNMDVGGSGGGTGTVNIEDGNLIMGGGVGGVFGSAAMGVGIEGSTGFLNVGDGIGAADTAILNLLTNNNVLAIGSNNGLPSGSTAGTGTAVVAADGAILLGSGTIYVGNSRTSLTDFGSGTLTINGGELGQGASSSGEIRIGSDGGVGTFNVNAGTALDPLTVLTVGELNIGQGVGADVGLTPSVGTATINILATDVFSVGSVSVGRGGGNGTLNVNGVSVAAVTEFRVGRDAGSIGAATIAAGSTLNASGISGIGGGGTGTLNVNGTFATTNLGVGQGGGTGTVNVTGLVTINPGGGQSYAGDGAGSTGTVNVTGPAVVNNVSGQDWQIGFNGGTGNLNVVGGGKVNFNWWLNIARGGSSVGNVLVDGAGSAINLDGGGDINWNVGEDGIGTMTVRNGATVDHDNAVSYRSHVGRNGGSNGTLNVESGAVVSTMELFAGTNGGATGTININTGGRVTLQQWMEVGSRGGVGVINIDGVGSSLENIGGGDGRNGGAGGDAQVGYEGGNGTINVTNGGTYATSWWLNVARGGASTGTVNVDGPGSSVQVGQSLVPTNRDAKVNIGEQGTGTFNLTNGAKLIVSTPGTGGAELFVGRDAGSNGTLNVRSGSEVQANGSWAMIVGQSGTGTVNVETGGKVLSNNWLVVGNEATSNGTINIDSDVNSLVEAGTPAGGSHEGRFVTGRLGTATVNQAGGIARADNWFAIGIDGGGNGTYNLNGGKIELAMPNYGDRNVIVGNNGTGTLNITAGEIVSSIVDGNHGTSINQFNVGGDTTGNGTLNINLADPNGKIIHRELYVAWGANGVNTGSGTVNITSGTLQTDGWVEIGRGQANDGNTGTVNVDGPNARWERGTLAPNNLGDKGARDMNIGQGENPNFGKGFLNVLNGGTVNHNWWINLARQPGTEGHVLVDGAGSTINMVDAHLVGLGGDGNSQFNVGEGGTGTARILNGGVFNHNMDNGGGETWIARNDGANGTMTVDGAGSQYNSKGREFRIAGNSGTGTLNITNGGVVNFTSTRENGVAADGNFGLAENGTGVATINMDGGQLNITAWSMFAAWNGAGTTATINMTNSTINLFDTQYIDGGGNPGNGGHLFWGDSGTATINQEGGLINAQGWSAIGRERGGNATYNLGVLGGGGAMTVGGLGGNELYVGRQSHGTINMGAGTSITVANALVLGQEISPTTPSSGTINNNGGAITVGGALLVGGNTGGVVGTYTQNAGSALVVNGEMVVGNDGATGVANILGGTVTALNRVAIGRGVAAFAVTNYATADEVINGGPELAFSVTANYTTSNTQDNNDAGGPFGLGVQLQGLPAGDNNDFAFVGLGTFTVDTTGSYTFGNNTDDGSRLRLDINGAGFNEIITDNVLSGPHDAFSAPIVLTMGDTITLDWMWFERGGGAEGETFYSRDGGPNALWEDATQGLTLVGGQYSGTVYKSAFTASTGTVNLNGGVLSTTFIESGVGNATLSFGGGTLGLLQNESDLIRGFTNSGGHSGIILTAAGGTIDTAGFDGRIQQSNVFVDTDASSVDGLAGTVLNKAGLGTLTLESAVDTNGTVSVHVLAGTLDFEASQTLDALVIDGGATVTMSALSSPPAPPAPLEAAALYDGGVADFSGASDTLVTASVQGVPEPGTIGLLLVSVLGMLGRPTRRKQD